jgi:hypothetical protein
MNTNKADSVGTPSGKEVRESPDRSVIKENNDTRSSSYTSAHGSGASLQQGPKIPASDKPGKLRDDTTSSQDDVEMPDHSFEQLVMQRTDSSAAEPGQSESGAQEHIVKTVLENNVPERANYLVGLVSSSTTPDENRICENSSPEEADRTQDSLEAQRQHRAASYDPAALDSWLMKQSLSDDDNQPTPQELIDTQLWGHIDPQAVWPKKHSEEWLAEKRKEIEARGGRKANFGKLLTPQVIKERRENGWNMHQNKAIVNDEKSEEAAKALQELFGIEDIDDLEPSVRGGQLVMVEKAVDEEGRRRKKPVTYVVG